MSTIGFNNIITICIKMLLSQLKGILVSLEKKLSKGENNGFKYFEGIFNKSFNVFGLSLASQIK